MVSASTLLKKFANVNHSVIDSYEFSQNLNGEDILKIYLHPYKTYANRCPVCGRRCKVYDRSKCTRKWRAPLGDTIVCDELVKAIEGVTTNGKTKLQQG